MPKYSDIIKSNSDFQSVVDALPLIKLKHLEIECLRLHDVMNSSDQWQVIRQKYLRDYDPNTRLHSHSWYELSCIDVGEIEYYTDDTHVRISDRNLFMMPPGVRHGWTPVSSNYLILGFHLNIRALSIHGKGMIKALHHKLVNESFSLRSTDRLKEAVRQIRSCSRDASFGRHLLEAFLRMFLFESLEIATGDIIQDNEGADVQKNKNQDIARQISEIIKDNIHLPLQLDDIAQHFDLTSRHLNRIFTAEEGLSIGKYILRQKLTHARLELLTSDAPVKAIAYEYGFSQPSYFCRIFKKAYGESPSDYRQNHNRV